MTEEKQETVEETPVEEKDKIEGDSEEEEDVDESKLPFPKATIVNMMRKHLSPGKQIKGRVKTEMNLWLGKIVERIAEKMDTYPYSYVDGSMFREAIEPYEHLEQIEIEKGRIIKQLDSIKAECDVLINEVDSQFVLRSGFANSYLKQAKEKKE